MQDKETDHQEISIAAEQIQLEGDLLIPANPRGIVLFAHGSGSSRLSPRNRHVARVLQQAGLATLLLDLLTDREERIDDRSGELRFDIEFLAGRLLAAADWVAQQAEIASLPLGLFGASTGAAAALMAAAEHPRQVRAVVSRGGRPDLARQALLRVEAPTLLIVGGEDRVVIDLNEEAAGHLQAEHRIEIIPGATHLFEEAGALDRVAQLARDWFVQYLRDSGTRAA